MTQTIQAWQCIGCGKLEAPQNCIGVCQDRRVELVLADEHAALARALADVEARHDALAVLVARLAAAEAAEPTVLAALVREAKDLLRPRQAAAASTGEASPVDGADASARARVGEAKPRIVQRATLYVR